MSNVGQQLFSGALSGFATTVCLQPFDLIKTRLQQGDRSLRTSFRSSVILETSKAVISQNGLKGLWRGTFPSLARNVPGVALYMTSLTQLRAFMALSPYFSRVKKCPEDTVDRSGSVLPTLTNQGNLLAGATTRVVVGFFLNPFSVLKVRFESNLYTYHSLSSALVAISHQGPSELLRGFTASSLRDAPYAGLFVVFYEAFKRETLYLFPASTSSQVALMHSLSGACAGTIATLATHPFDVIKTKVQVRQEKQYNGFFRTVVTIWKSRGVIGYFDGASLRLSRKVLSSAIGWAVYEGMLKVMY